MSITTSKLAAGAGAALVSLGLASIAQASGGGGEHHWDWTDFIARCINFTIMGGTVFFLARKPLSSALSSRTENIKQELADLEAKREAAKKEFAEMEKRLADSEGEREKVLEQFRVQGQAEKAKIIDNAQTLAERIKAQAKFTIDQETALAKNELRQEIADLSAQVAEDMLKQNINDDDQVRLVDEYLAKVQQEVQ